MPLLGVSGTGNDDTSNSHAPNMCRIVLPSGELGFFSWAGFFEFEDGGDEEAWFESDNEDDEKMSVGVEGSGGDPGKVDDCADDPPTNRKVSTILPIPLTAARQLGGLSCAGLLSKYIILCQE